MGHTVSEGPSTYAPVELMAKIETLQIRTDESAQLVYNELLSWVRPAITDVAKRTDMKNALEDATSTRLPGPSRRAWMDRGPCFQEKRVCTLTCAHVILVNVCVCSIEIRGVQKVHVTPEGPSLSDGTTTDWLTE